MRSVISFLALVPDFVGSRPFAEGSDINFLALVPDIFSGVRLSALVPDFVGARPFAEGSDYLHWCQTSLVPDPLQRGQT